MYIGRYLNNPYSFATFQFGGTAPAGGYNYDPTKKKITPVAPEKKITQQKGEAKQVGGNLGGLVSGSSTRTPSSSSSPRTPSVGGTGASKNCGGCNSGDFGCEIGKFFCEGTSFARNW